MKSGQCVVGVADRKEEGEDVGDGSGCVCGRSSLRLLGSGRSESSGALTYEGVCATMPGCCGRSEPGSAFLFPLVFIIEEAAEICCCVPAWVSEDEESAT